MELIVGAVMLVAAARLFLLEGSGRGWSLRVALTILIGLGALTIARIRDGESVWFWIFTPLAVVVLTYLFALARRAPAD